MSDPAPPPCEICEQYRMEDARWILESHINGLHQELAALTAVTAPSALPKCEHAWDYGCDCFCSKCGEDVCPTTVALTAENERLREMLQSVIDHEDSVLWTRAERNRLSREARALLTEEGKP